MNKVDSSSSSSSSLYQHLCLYRLICYSTLPWTQKAPAGGWPACWSLHHRCWVWSWGWRVWPVEGDAVWRGGRAYGVLREGGSEEVGLWVGAWLAVVLYPVDLKKQKVFQPPSIQDWTIFDILNKFAVFHQCTFKFSTDDLALCELTHVALKTPLGFDSWQMLFTGIQPNIFLQQHLQLWLNQILEQYIALNGSIYLLLTTIISRKTSCLS